MPATKELKEEILRKLLAHRKARLKVSRIAKTWTPGQSPKVAEQAEAAVRAIQAEVDQLLMLYEREEAGG